MDVEEIINKLKDRNLKKVAEAIGVHYNTLYKIVKKEGNPSYDTLIKLNGYLNG